VRPTVRRSPTRAVAACVLLVLTVTACAGGGGGDSGSAEPEGRPEAASQPQAATTIETAQSRFGQILVDERGMTLYMFDPDEQSGKSVCDADCLAAWPPVKGPAEAGQGADESLLGTTQATDGTTMATYNDWPLYYWVKDKQPGDVTGQAVNDVWWVLTPDGRPVRSTP
jgi:predicted lipoprotein with Yx(FWY)xxD motif